jgi:hypothetical protein
MKTIVRMTLAAAATTSLVAGCGGGMQGGSNEMPQIAALADTSINQDTSTGPIGFAVSDRETSADALTIEVASSDSTLLPLEGIVVGGSGANRTITVTPAPAQTGSGVVTLTVADGQGARSARSFRVTVSAVLVSFKDWTTTAYGTPEGELPATVDGFTFQPDADDDPAAFDSLLQ